MRLDSTPPVTIHGTIDQIGNLSVNTYALLNLSNCLCNSCMVWTLRQTVGQTVCSTFARSDHTVQLFHRQFVQQSYSVNGVLDRLSRTTTVRVTKWWQYPRRHTMSLAQILSVETRTRKEMFGNLSRRSVGQTYCSHICLAYLFCLKWKNYGRLGITLVFWAPLPLQNSKRNPLSGALNTLRWENYAIFDRNSSLSRKRHEIGPIWLHPRLRITLVT